MAALWPQFISIVGNYLDDASEGKTHEETAEKIASEYHKAVKAAKTSLHANPVLSQAPYEPIKVAILKTLNDIRNSEGYPQISNFTDWANTTSSYWLATTMSPVPFHPGNIALSTGTAGIPAPITHIISNGGVIPALQSDLLKAFTHRQSNIKYGIPFATKLVTAFRNHLSTVGGIHTELVTPGTPITPGPPFPSPLPWTGLV